MTVTEPSDSMFLYPLGDLHVGDKAFGKVGRGKFLGYRDWIINTPNAYAFLMGDILNTASRNSATSPFEGKSGDDEYQEAVDLLRPLADTGRIIGAITGNHERRMEDSFGFNPLKPFCNELGIPYLGYSAVVKFRVGARPEPEQNQVFNTYHGYFHHGTGGGGTLGAALNRKVKLQDIVQGVDFYVSGHDHQLVTGVRAVFEPGKNGIKQRKLTYVDSGSFLDYEDSYAEAAMYAPGKLGAPRIRLDGRKDKHDLHVSL